MEFVSDHREVRELLDACGIQSSQRGEEEIGLEMTGGDSVVHLHLGCDGSSAVPRDGASTLTVERSELASILEQVLQHLHLSEVLLIPVGKWRGVFDAVAFSLAENEDWQAIDAAATVELNTRDPLLCGPGDLQLLSDLIGALLDDAERPDQGLMIVSTGSPVLAEVVPDGAIRISVGSQVLADEVLESVAG